MDAGHFDSLTRTLATPRLRRGILRALAALPVGAFTALRGDPGHAKRRRRAVRPEIVGGTPVSQGTYGFMTFLEASDSGGQIAFTCGGTVIAPRFVLTAAHCVLTPQSPVFPPEAFWLGIGQVDENLFTAENAFGAVAVTVHPDWNPNPQDGAFTNLDYDVAILELNRPVPADLAKPLALVGAGDTRFDGAGQPVVVTGWGLTTDSGQPSTRLLQADLAVFSEAECTAFHEGFYVPEIMVCAGAPGHSSCQGDSGGPIFVEETVGYRKKKTRKGKKKRIPIIQQTQVGISSWASVPTCDANPNGFVRLSTPVIRDFIRNVTGV